jgi:hypothetical protein
MNCVSDSGVRLADPGHAVDGGRPGGAQQLLGAGDLGLAAGEVEQVGRQFVAAGLAALLLTVAVAGARHRLTIPAAKFKSRYAMLGFSDEARLDDGDMWATYFAITELSTDVESRISTLVGRAA